MGARARRGESGCDDPGVRAFAEDTDALCEDADMFCLRIGLGRAPSAEICGLRSSGRPPAATPARATRTSPWRTMGGRRRERE